MAADLSLMKKASAVKKPEAAMSRQDRKKAGMAVSPLGKVLEKIKNAKRTPSGFEGARAKRG